MYTKLDYFYFSPFDPYEKVTEISTYNLQSSEREITKF